MPTPPKKRRRAPAASGHGGARTGAGRPPGEPASQRTVRAPDALWAEIDRIAEEHAVAVRVIVIEALQLRVAQDGEEARDDSRAH